MGKIQVESSISSLVMCIMNYVTFLVKIVATHFSKTLLLHEEQKKKDVNKHLIFYARMHNVPFLYARRPRIGSDYRVSSSDSVSVQQRNGNRENSREGNSQKVSLI